MRHIHHGDFFKRRGEKQKAVALQGALWAVIPPPFPCDPFLKTLWRDRGRMVAVRMRLKRLVGRRV